MRFFRGIIVAVSILAPQVGSAATIYYNLFNIEGERSVDAAFVTYDNLIDMLNDENRTGLFVSDGSVLFGTNLVGSGSDGTSFWNLFNIEGESSIDAAFATYASFDDMLNDENRTGVVVADGSVLFGTNIVGTGSDGTTYWNLFNVEGESSLDAAYVTYDNLTDMLNDENRTGLFVADGSGIFGANIVGSGSDGTTYWNLFNIEGESSVDAAFVTYGSVADMFNDENRTGVFIPDGSGIFGVNIVGTGAYVVPTGVVPLPASASLLGFGLGLLVFAKRRNI